MALYDWWKKKFQKEVKEEKLNALEDIKAIQDSLNEVQVDLKYILPRINNLEELEKEFEVAKLALKKINLQAQSQMYDELLERYGFYQTDIEINGLRLKKLAERFLQLAEKNELKDLVRKKKKDSRWKMFW